MLDHCDVHKFICMHACVNAYVHTGLVKTVNLQWYTYM